MATEQDWAAYADQGFLAETDTLLARTAAGGGVEVPASALMARRTAGGPCQARGRVSFEGYDGAAGTPSEAFDWTYPVQRIVGYGDFSLQTMLAFALPNDPETFADTSIWNFRLVQTANATTSAGVQGLRLGGPGNLALVPGTATLINTTGTFDGVSGLPCQVQGGIAINTPTTATTTAVSFFNSQGAGVRVGWIGTSGSTTLYNTTSDATLKDDEGLIDHADAAAIMRLIEIHRFRWKLNGQKDIGAFAQELHKVFPHAVTPGGWLRKDGALADNEEADTIYVPWSVDYSALVPVMAAAWQNLDARLAAIEARAD